MTNILSSPRARSDEGPQICEKPTVADSLRIFFIINVLPKIHGLASKAPSGKSSAPPAPWPRPIPSGSPPNIRTMRRTCFITGIRYYNASAGRWISRDTLSERGGKNLYGFVRNNPAGRIDVLGQKCCLITVSRGPALGIRPLDTILR